MIIFKIFNQRFKAVKGFASFRMLCKKTCFFDCGLRFLIQHFFFIRYHILILQIILY